MNPCCSPARQGSVGGPGGLGGVDDVVAIAAGGHRVAQRPIAGGSFTMGDSCGDGLRADGEVPVHTVTVSAFAMDETAVSVADFAAFVDATGFRTSAQRAGSSAVFHALVDPADTAGRVTAAPWWVDVVGADWAHPDGPGSDVSMRADHPVVHVSFVDATAYCAWAGRLLPTEAQWECAARGGLHGARFPWGHDRETVDGDMRCQIYADDLWGAPFPSTPGSRVGAIPTASVSAYAPNGFGLRQMVGNVWEWCADRFDPRYYRSSPTHDPCGPDRGASRVLRGGSYLCDDSYCSRYRVSARSHNTVESSSGNIGFRTVARV